MACNHNLDLSSKWLQIVEEAAKIQEIIHQNSYTAQGHGLHSDGVRHGTHSGKGKFRMTSGIWPNRRYRAVHVWPETPRTRRRKADLFELVYFYSGDCIGIVRWHRLECLAARDSWRSWTGMMAPRSTPC